MSKSVKSTIWNFFTKHSLPWYAKCNICSGLFSYMSSITNLKKHMKNKHPTVSIDTISSEIHSEQKFASDDEDGRDPMEMLMLKKTVPSAAAPEFNIVEFEHSTQAASITASSETVHVDEVATTLKQQRKKVTPARKDPECKRVKRRGPVWNFFTKDAVPYYAKCNICKRKFSYKTTSTNLKKHIKTMHPTVCINKISQELLLEQNFGSDDEDGGDPMEMLMLKKTVPSAAAPEFNLEELEHSTQAASTTASSDPFYADEVITTLEQQQKKVKLIPLLQQTLSASQKTKIDEALMKLFTKDFQPFSIVEDDGFIEYCHALNPSYNLPSREVLTETMVP